MKIAITGHRLYKLENYNLKWLRDSLKNLCVDLPIGIGVSGMASGIDLWYCQILRELSVPYIACIPFEEQQERVESFERELRLSLISSASQVKQVRNSHMIESCDACIVVWDGNKGGTHNCVQQLVENNKPFYWINPCGQKIWNCV